MERLNKTLLDEFYSLAFRRKVYGSIEELQVNLDEFMDYYSYRRTHQGYKLKENGYGTPAEAHLKEKSKKGLTKGLRSNKIKVAMTNERKGVGEKTILTGQVLADDFVKPRSEEEEVLACQFVTTS